MADILLILLLKALVGVTWQHVSHLYFSAFDFLALEGVLTGKEGSAGIAAADTWVCGAEFLTAVSAVTVWETGFSIWWWNRSNSSAFSLMNDYNTPLQH